MKRTFSLALCLLMLLTACGNAESAETENTAANADVPETVETETEEVPDLPADLAFGGSVFTFGVLDNPNARNPIVMEELTGEALNDPQYNTIATTTETLDVVIEE